MASFRSLPVETRQEIFKLCLTLHPASEAYHKYTSYKRPALLVALRGDKGLYYEAIYVFYKFNTLYYRRTVHKNKGNYKVDGLDAFKNLRHLGIDMKLNDNLAQEFIAKSKDFPTFSGQVANHLETININVIGCPDNLGEIHNLLQVLGPHLTKLKRVSLNIIAMQDKWEEQMAIFLSEDLMSLMNVCKLAWLRLNLSYTFGVKGTHVSTTTSLRNGKTLEQFVWEAKKGEVLIPSVLRSTTEHRASV